MIRGAQCSRRITTYLWWMCKQISMANSSLARIFFGWRLGMVTNFSNDFQSIFRSRNVCVCVWWFFARSINKPWECALAHSRWLFSNQKNYRCVHLISVNVQTEISKNVNDEDLKKSVPDFPNVNGIWLETHSKWHAVNEHKSPPITMDFKINLNEINIHGEVLCVCVRLCRVHRASVWNAL